ncbi:MAG: exosome 3'-_5 exonuclease subunit ski4 (Csl4) [Piccolia ochrophora]|nr:MAG: exosome 3'->5 exonuclease subunit ski4 (Csl4) [Piccolia ochrophora]
MTTTSTPLPTIRLPGDPIPISALPSSTASTASKQPPLPGPGTHLHNAHLTASLAGSLLPSTPNPSSSSSSTASIGISTTGQQPQPEVDATVLCRITRIQTRLASASILVVGEAGVCWGEWAGVIRVQDIRLTEKDKVKVSESFRPGDIVRAVVISLGDQANYYLSTASNHLGVVMATSEAGNAMYPVNWREFRDPVTGGVERRKVAKPF